MIKQDTIKLLREFTSIDDVQDYVKNTELLRILTNSKDKHIELEKEIDALLTQLHDDGKDPNPIAKGMSWAKTNLKLVMENSDQTIAGLITDGCGMGTKTLTRYLNQYPEAEEQAKTLVRKLIKTEEKLAEDMRPYL